MKIATYNVNGVNGRLPVLLRWLEESAPDIVCLQELKAPDDKFPEKPIRDLGYDMIWQGQKSWNGVGDPQPGRRNPRKAQSVQKIAVPTKHHTGTDLLRSGHPAGLLVRDHIPMWYHHKGSRQQWLLCAGVRLRLVGYRFHTYILLAFDIKQYMTTNPPVISAGRSCAQEVVLTSNWRLCREANATAATR